MANCPFTLANEMRDVTGSEVLAHVIDVFNAVGWPLSARDSARPDTMPSQLHT